MVLVSLTYAVAAARMARRGVLAQQLNAIESLASVEVLCVDKTGTLTEAALRVTEFCRPPGAVRRRLAGALARFAASASSRNATLQAIADAYPGEPEPALGEVPFSSRRALERGAAGRRHVRSGRARTLLARARCGGSRPSSRVDGRRVLALARGRGAAVRRSGADELPPAEAEPLGLVVLAERLRPNVAGDDRLPARAGRRGQGALRRLARRPSRRSPATSVSRCAASALGSAIPEEPAEPAAWCAAGERRRAHLAGGKARRRAGARRRGPLRGDARRRRQRRARAEGLSPGDRPGQRGADVAQRGRPGARLRRLRGRADARGRRPPRAAQPAAGDQALRDQVGVRRVPDPDDRDHLDRLSAASPPLQPRGGADDRDTDVLPRARAEQRAVAARGVRAPRRPLGGARPGRSRASGSSRAICSRCTTSTSRWPARARSPRSCSSPSGCTS